MRSSLVLVLGLLALTPSHGVPSSPERDSERPQVSDNTGFLSQLLRQVSGLFSQDRVSMTVVENTGGGERNSSSLNLDPNSPEFGQNVADFIAKQVGDAGMSLDDLHTFIDDTIKNREHGDEQYPDDRGEVAEIPEIPEIPELPEGQGEVTEIPEIPELPEDEEDEEEESEEDERNRRKSAMYPRPLRAANPISADHPEVFGNGTDFFEWLKDIIARVQERMETNGKTADSAALDERPGQMDGRGKAARQSAPKLLRLQSQRDLEDWNKSETEHGGFDVIPKAVPMIVMSGNTYIKDIGNFRNQYSYGELPVSVKTIEPNGNDSGLELGKSKVMKHKRDGDQHMVNPLKRKRDGDLHMPNPLPSRIRGGGNRSDDARHDDGNSWSGGKDDGNDPWHGHDDGSRWSGGRDDGGSSWHGNDDGSRRSGGIDDGSSSWHGHDDGSRRSVGRDDGSNSWHGHDDGSRRSGGKDDEGSSWHGNDDGSRRGGGRDDGSNSWHGHDDGGSRSGGKDDEGSSWHGNDDGSRWSGGRDDGSNSWHGHDDGSRRSGGRDDGSKSWHGNDDGSRRSGGRDDGNNSWHGHDDGSRRSGGRDDGSRRSGGKDDGGNSWHGHDDGSKRSGGRDQGGSSWHGHDDGSRRSGGRDDSGRSSSKDDGNAGGSGEDPWHGHDDGGRRSGGRQQLIRTRDGTLPDGHTPSDGKLWSHEQPERRDEKKHLHNKEDWHGQQPGVNKEDWHGQQPGVNKEDWHGQGGKLLRNSFDRTIEDKKFTSMNMSHIALIVLGTVASVGVVVVVAVLKRKRVGLFRRTDYLDI